MTFGEVTGQGKPEAACQPPAWANLGCSASKSLHLYRPHALSGSRKVLRGDEQRGRFTCIEVSNSAYTCITPVECRVVKATKVFYAGP